jgi:hypothetical protein
MMDKKMEKRKRTSWTFLSDNKTTNNQKGKVQKH